MANRVFDYRNLCTSQEIAIEVPVGTQVELAEVDILIDMLLKSMRLFNRVERLKHICISELQFAQANGGNVRVTFTEDVAREANEAFKSLESPVGLNTAIKNMKGRDLSQGFLVTKMLASTGVDILYTQLRSIMTFIINKNNTYEKYGSSEGYTPFLDVENCVSIIEKSVHMQNHIYDMIYVLGNVSITSLSSTYFQNTPTEMQARLTKYEIFKGEGANAINIMMKSFDPSVRFVVSEGEDIIYNF